MPRVFIASKLPMGDIISQFGFLPTEFEMTSDPNEAEYIIYDLSNIPDNWPLFLGLPTYHKASVIFVALGAEDTCNWDIVTRCYQCNPPKLKTASEVVEFLKWWAVNEERMRERTRDMILANQRGG